MTACAKLEKFTTYKSYKEPGEKIRRGFGFSPMKEREKGNWKTIKK